MTNRYIKRERLIHSKNNENIKRDIVLGINPKSINFDDNEHPIKLGYIWMHGFQDVRKLKLKQKNRIIKSVLEENNHSITIYVYNQKYLKEMGLIIQPKLYFINNNDNINDIWESIIFNTALIKNNLEEYIKTDDCKIKIKWVFYSLIGYKIKY